MSKIQGEHGWRLKVIVGGVLAILFATWMLSSSLFFGGIATVYAACGGLLAAIASRFLGKVGSFASHSTHSKLVFGTIWFAIYYASVLMAKNVLFKWMTPGEDAAMSAAVFVGCFAGYSIFFPSAKSRTKEIAEEYTNDGNHNLR